MRLTIVQKVCVSVLTMASAAAPGMALDYEAKPVNWAIQAPVRLLGGLTGALVSGAVSGPIDDGYHWFLKGSKHVAGKFGDEKGAGQLAVGVPTGGSVGLVLGTGYGVLDGTWHGFKKGWEKPFSRWSYVTMEEK